jgi:hypothetical protein
MQKSIIFLFTVMVINGQIMAQCPGKSPFWGLNCFLNSDFINKFEEVRNKAEQSVRDFKQLAAAEGYSDDDVERVKDAYNASANNFNNVLYKIKGDLLDRNKRKLIVREPDIYLNEVDVVLRKAKASYANTYQKTVTEVTGGRITATPLLILLPELIKYGKIAFEIFQKIKAEVKKYNDAMFEQYLVQPNRFHSWDEIN